MEAAKGIAILIIAFFLGFNFYQDMATTKQVVMLERVVTETTNNTAATLKGMDYEIDSLHKHIGKLATATVYLDSCQQQKTVKAERAERRGRFVGGLLKGLLPF
jgi:hypothetical protein